MQQAVQEASNIVVGARGRWHQESNEL